MTGKGERDWSERERGSHWFTVNSTERRGFSEEEKEIK
jgi:hypothetical protein